MRWHTVYPCLPTLIPWESKTWIHYISILDWIGEHLTKGSTMNKKEIIIPTWTTSRMRQPNGRLIWMEEESVYSIKLSDRLHLELINYSFQNRSLNVLKEWLIDSLTIINKVKSEEISIILLNFKWVADWVWMWVALGRRAVFHTVMWTIEDFFKNNNTSIKKIYIS